MFSLGINKIIIRESGKIIHSIFMRFNREWTFYTDDIGESLKGVTD